MRAVVWTALICLVVVPLARATSFDCSKASTFVEKAICSDKQLSGLDGQLAGLYKTARAAAANSATLESEQKAWLSARDNALMPLASRRPMPIGSPPSKDPQRLQRPEPSPARTR
jgi:uncharacterized protein